MWRSIKAWIASSTVDIWRRAILWSLLKQNNGIRNSNNTGVVTNVFLKTCHKNTIKLSFVETVYRKVTYWKNLNAFTVPPVLANSVRRSSSATDGLQTENKHNQKITNPFSVLWLVLILLPYWQPTLTEYWIDEELQMEGIYSESFLNQVSWSDAAVNYQNL